MANIKIEYLSDSHDCETCGGSWAGGYNVSVDGFPFGDFEPVASCFGGSRYSLEDVYRALLRHFGHELEAV